MSVRSAPERTGHGEAAPASGAFVAVWAVALTVLLALLFTGMTAMTVGLWWTDPGYALTNPVVDLAFFALGGILVAGGLASQIGGRPVAGLQQAILALLALSVAGLLGARVEPFVGPLVLLLATSPLIVWHPRRRRLLAAGEGMSWPLLALALAAAGPATVYAAGMLVEARAAGPSCFLGQCVQGDRYAEAAALAIAVLLVALLASLRTPGWPWAAWCAGSAAVVLGGASWVLPGEQGALTPTLAVASVLWGVTFTIVAHRLAHRPAGPQLVGPVRPR